jgi:hypothetical protein
MSEEATTQLKPLKSYCNRIPGHRSGTKAHVSTLIRHATTGVRSPAGQMVKLQAVRFGNHWLTTDEWWGAFLNAISTVDTTTPAAPRSPIRRQREAELAEAELLARGA